MTNEQIAAQAAGPADQGEAADTGEPTDLVGEGSLGADEVEPKGPRKLSWEDAIKTVPPDVAKLMRSMQSDYTKKTQEAAQLRKDSLREREAMMRGARNLVEEKPLPAFDPFDEGSINARVEAEVKRRLQEVLAPMQHEYETMAAEEAYQSFLSANPDFESNSSLRGEVQKALEANPALDLETAYWSVKGRLSQQDRAKAEGKAKAEREATRKAALTGTGNPRRAGDARAPSSQELKTMSAADILKHAKALNGIR